MSGKLLAICGHMASGKTTLCQYLTSHMGYSRVITYTTRHPRENEVVGRDYNFVTDSCFQELSARNFFAEETSYDASFGHVRYGTSKASIAEPSGKVIVLNPDGIRALHEAGIPLFVVYLDIPQEVCMRRAGKRGDTPVEIGRRVAADSRKFDFLVFDDLVDIHITNGRLLPYQIAEMIQGAEMRVSA